MIPNSFFYIMIGAIVLAWVLGLIFGLIMGKNQTLDTLLDARQITYKAYESLRHTKLWKKKKI